MGSPPRMRGKEKGINFPASKVGITPAYAGKSTPSLSHRGSLRDHPRVCGEKARTLIVQNEPQGSPPRMRGKAFLRQCGYSLVGITPAYAGKSFLSCTLQCMPWDHPRVCGEKSCSSSSVMPLKGSPPRMQGKGAFQILHHLFIRITPAYAGKRHAVQCCVQMVKDHPRMCGEKPLGLAPAGWPSGSPPHVRGKDSAIEVLQTLVGITPACAGKSGFCSFPPGFFVGSPPHVRGKVVQNEPQFFGARITPACAGKSFCSIAFLCLFWDHPRMCGEKRWVYRGAH